MHERMDSGLYLVVFIAFFGLACPLVHGGTHSYRQGTLIDTGEYDWCHYDCAPFDRPTLFFCVQVGGEILVGSSATDWIWGYDGSKMFALKGKAVSLRFDHDSIWIIRTDGKEMRLTQNYSRDVFVSEECSAEVHRHWLRELKDVQRPSAVPADAVLIPQGSRTAFKSEGPHFWVSCSFDSKTDWDLCDLWDEKGVKYKTVKCVDSSGKPVARRDLVVDPLTTKVDYEIHLMNGSVLTAHQ